MWGQVGEGLPSSTATFLSFHSAGLNNFTFKDSQVLKSAQETEELVEECYFIRLFPTDFAELRTVRMLDGPVDGVHQHFLASLILLWDSQKLLAKGREGRQREFATNRAEKKG